METMMESRTNNKQQFIKSQTISLVISFVMFNAILRDGDWLVLSAIGLIALLTIIVKIFGRKLEVGEEEPANHFRRTS
jgi:hypothetical protein